MHLEDGLYFRDGLLLIPDDSDLKAELLLEHHSSPYSGHPGRERTLKLLRRHVCWPHMAADVKHFVQHCDSCQRSKAGNALPGGLLQPLQVPDQPWESVSMDFVVHLPQTVAGYTAIMVCVDRLTKMVHLAPCRDTSSAEDVAKLFFNTVFVKHGLPLDVVTDRDSRFTSKFWRALCAAVGTKLSMSTAFHPQSDGNTERVNRVMEDMLRHVVAADQSD